MPPPSLFVIVPGFGRPHLAEKFDILRNNLQVIQSYPWSKLKIRVCVYDPDAIASLPEDLRNHPDIEWIVEPGIVGQYIKRNAHPETVAGYTYMLIVLDDIKLHNNVSFDTLLRYDAMFRFDIYSPSMCSESKYQFEYMLSKPAMISHILATTACEAFCYFMPLASFTKYYEHIEPDKNPWLWGMDMCILKCIGLRPAILNHMVMTHYYKNECYALRADKDPVEGYNYVMEKYGVSTAELSEQKAVLYHIIDTELFPT